MRIIMRLKEARMQSDVGSSSGRQAVPCWTLEVHQRSSSNRGLRLRAASLHHPHFCVSANWLQTWRTPSKFGCVSATICSTLTHPSHRHRKPRTMRSKTATWTRICIRVFWSSSRGYVCGTLADFNHSKPGTHTLAE